MKLSEQFKNSEKMKDHPELALYILLALLIESNSPNSLTWAPTEIKTKSDNHTYNYLQKGEEVSKKHEISETIIANFYSNPIYTNWAETTWRNHLINEGMIAERKLILNQGEMDNTQLRNLLEIIKLANAQKKEQSQETVIIIDSFIRPQGVEITSGKTNAQGFEVKDD